MLGVTSLIYTQFMLWLQDYIPLAMSQSLHACRSAACKKMFFFPQGNMNQIWLLWVSTGLEIPISHPFPVTWLTRQSAVLWCLWHLQDVHFYWVIHNYCYKLICEMRLLTGVWHSFCWMADIHHLQSVRNNSHWRILWDSLWTQR